MARAYQRALRIADLPRYVRLRESGGRSTCPAPWSSKGLKAARKARQERAEQQHQRERLKYVRLALAETRPAIRQALWEAARGI